LEFTNKNDEPATYGIWPSQYEDEPSNIRIFQIQIGSQPSANHQNIRFKPTQILDLINSSPKNDLPKKHTMISLEVNTYQDVTQKEQRKTGA